MRKMLSVMMAAAIAGSLLAGCSSSTTETTAAASSAEETTTAAEETTTEAASESAAEETVMHVFIASAGVFVACMFPIHQFLYLFSTSHGLFSIPLRHTQNLSLPKTSSGKCSNRTGCSLPS